MIKWMFLLERLICALIVFLSWRREKWPLTALSQDFSMGLTSSLFKKVLRHVPDIKHMLDSPCLHSRGRTTHDVWTLTWLKMAHPLPVKHKRIFLNWNPNLKFRFYFTLFILVLTRVSKLRLKIWKSERKKVVLTLLLLKTPQQNRRLSLKNSPE